MWIFIKSYTFKYWRYYLFGLLFLVITNYLTTVIPLKLKSH